MTRCSQDQFSRRRAAVSTGRFLTTLLVVGAIGLSAAAPARSQELGSPAEADAFAAALQIFDAVPYPDCLSNNPAQQLCLRPTVPGNPLSADNADRGIAAVEVNSPEGVLAQQGRGGYPDSGLGVLGRDGDGVWQFYFRGQQYYQLVRLPGNLLICAGGDGINVRAQPNTAAPVVASLPDGSSLRAEAFVETEPGNAQAREAGAGWYQISTPQDGWVYSRFVSGQPTCALHDALEGR